MAGIMSEIEDIVNSHIAGIMNEIEDIVDNHMHRQPYDMVCAVCHGGVEGATEIDNDKDLTQKITPCEKCMTDKYEEGIAEGSGE